MADFSSLTYSGLQTAIADWMARADLTSNTPDFITLFETEANRTLRTRQMETVVLLYPQSSVQFAVNNATSNGGLIRLSFTTTSTSTGPATGTEVFVNNIAGTAEANNTWLATNISSTVIDLQGSGFVNAYVSGGIVNTPSGTAALPSDYLTWRRVTWSGTPNRVLEYVQPDILRIYHPIISNSNLILANDAPSMFTIEDGNIIIRPVDPTAIEFDYYQKIPSLLSQSTTGVTLNSSSNWLLAAHPDLYLAGALAEGNIFIRNWDDAGLWKQRRDDIFERIAKLDQKTRGPSYIRPDMRGRIP